MTDTTANAAEPLQKQAPATPPAMRTFVIIWVGQVISIVGSSLTDFGIGVWIFQQTGDAMPFALTVLFGSLPNVLLLPVAGSLADRWNRRWLMILGDTGKALVTVVLVKNRIARDVRFAWRYLRERPGLFNLQLYYAGVNFFLSGVLVILVSAIAYLQPRIRRLEQEIPDAVPG
jgi:MFS family permease